MQLSPEEERLGISQQSPALKEKVVIATCTSPYLPDPFLLEPRPQKPLVRVWGTLGTVWNGVETILGSKIAIVGCFYEHR